jgi:hypothetical protein
LGFLFRGVIGTDEKSRILPWKMNFWMQKNTTVRFLIQKGFNNIHAILAQQKFICLRIFILCGLSACFL